MFEAARDSKRIEPEDRVNKYDALRHRHHEILRLIALGYENKEIAEKLGITPQTVSDLRHSPIAIERLAILNRERDEGMKDLRRTLDEDAPKSLKLLQDVRDGLEEGSTLAKRIEVARALLDKSIGNKAAAQIGSVNFNFTEKELERIKEISDNAVATAKQSGLIADADYEEVKVCEKDS